MTKVPQCMASHQVEKLDETVSRHAMSTGYVMPGQEPLICGGMNSETSTYFMDCLKYNFETETWTETGTCSTVYSECDLVTAKLFVLGNMQGGQRAFAGYTCNPDWGLIMAGGYHIAFYSKNPIRHRTGKY